jgi:hypothetical protein
VFNPIRFIESLQLNASEQQDAQEYVHARIPYVERQAVMGSSEGSRSCS